MRMRAALVAGVAALAGCSDAAEPAATTAGAGGSGGGTVTFPEPFTVTAFDEVRISSKSEDANFQQADIAIDLGEGPFASVRLVADLGTTCFPFETWQTNPPPQGENFPADCDAFDRNFEWSLDNPADDDEPPGLELVRAITPFGGPLHIDHDMTDVANGLGGGVHQLRVHITTWSDGAGQVSGSDGGWSVSAHIEVTPGVAPRDVLAVVPLYYAAQTSLPGPGELEFEVPEGVTSGYIAYRVTGHGGGQGDFSCSGPAEEFCNRFHAISIDGSEHETLNPWRSDCNELCTLQHYGPTDGGFDYCLENPTGSVASVKAPRANWCPGSETPPFLIEASELSVPGAHTLEWDINKLADGGSWKISATYVGY